MENKHIEEKWEDFRKHCVPPEAEFEKVQVARRIFFAGALVMHNMIVRDMPEGGSQDDLIKFLDSLAEELIEFSVTAMGEARKLTEA